MATTNDEDLQALASAAGVPKAALRASVHLRRYMPLYVFGTIWALMIVLLPTVHHSAKTTVANAAVPGEQSGVTGANQLPTEAGPQTTVAATPGAPGAPGAAPTGPAAGGAAPGASPATAGKVTPPQVGAGVARSGVQCAPGVRQTPGSDYAAPCTAAYTGDNGGPTYNGVTKDSINIAIRSTADANGPNAQAVDRVNQQAGQLTATQMEQAFKDLLPFFNKNYELYGRQVKFIPYTGKGNGTDEAQSKGQEAACADANELASSVHAFGVINHSTFGYLSQPFAECAAQYHLYLPLAAPYFPEQYYQRWDPYVWGGTMECERIAHDEAEYVIKRLAGKKAKWAGDTLLQQSNRKFATYVPDNPGYGRCVSMTQADLKAHGVDPGDRYNYALDVSQFPSEAERGIIQFHQAADTTVTLACDPISITFLTQSASSQSYHPEWFIIGVALEDTDGYGRLYDQGEVGGHMFGMSQLGADTKLNAKDGEAARAFKAATGRDMPPGYAVIYYNLVLLFNQLQAAGPTLTPQNIGKASHALPPGGGPSGAIGTWNYGPGHTAITDSREVYYDPNGTGYDGKKGTFVEAYGGKRFASGQWPTEDPQVYNK
ncbi:MAG: hypothetical protein QOG64_3286 [Acidimicrobiaceae bacterium]|nr:hypothetical protein [Acidimicrobiaceae bacterium]